MMPENLSQWLFTSLSYLTILAKRVPISALFGSNKQQKLKACP